MKLFILRQDGGDGSWSTWYTLSQEVIDHLQEAYDRGMTDYEDLGVGVSGFEYESIIVPDDSTRESLGIDEDSWTTLEWAKSRFQFEP